MLEKFPSSHQASPPLLVAHEDEESEWWYYHGFLDASGRRFAFHLAFFRFRIDNIWLGGLLPLKFAAEQYRVAHFAVTDIDNGQFHYGFKRSLFGDAGASVVSYRTWIDDWSAEETPAGHRLCASIPNAQIRLDILADAVKPPLERRWDERDSKRARPRCTEFCFTRMAASGNIHCDGQVLPVTGNIWLDREFGDFPLRHDIGGWDWFAVQLENGTEFRIYQIYLGGYSPAASSFALVDAAGNATWLGGDEFTVTSLDHWTSPRTGIEYPTRWRINAASLNVSIEISACLCCNELDTRGSGNVIYWEGPAEVSGHLQHSPVKGRAFVELVGRGNGHRPLGVFDFKGNHLGVWDSLFNEIHQHLFGHGVSIAEAKD